MEGGQKIIRDVEIWFARVDPARPDKKLDPLKPKWNIQIRTKSKEQKKEWEAAGLRPKLVEDEENGNYYKVSIYKNASDKDDGTKAEPVKVVNGNNKPIDPKIIGNRSIGNIKIFQYESKKTAGQYTSVLMAMQITKLVLYTYTPSEDFDDVGETEVIDNTSDETSDDDKEF